MAAQSVMWARRWSTLRPICLLAPSALSFSAGFSALAGSSQSQQQMTAVSLPVLDLVGGVPALFACRVPFSFLVDGVLARHYASGASAADAHQRLSILSSRIAAFLGMMELCSLPSQTRSRIGQAAQLRVTCLLR